jgi:predicted DNA-binding protein (MmcQ/YjbR family)
MSKSGVTEGFPFDNKTMVWKVGNKMFCLGDIENFDSVNLKCNPEKAIELRTQYSQIQPGFHMSKTHWNTVSFENLGHQFINTLIDDSYELVFNSLTKKIKDNITHEL